ncbi:MAG TPA: hypothetical protein VKB72_09285, partial [Steroidobacteraceae bacterium]|nr:hypothetical protein [Steroidobacteraceae bacterium]
MSVIENAIKRLQASRDAAAAARPAAETEPVAAAAGTAAARQRESFTAPEATPAAPPRTIAVSEDALRAAGLLPPPHQERELAQQFRQIKRPLINRALGRGVEALPQGNLVMVASAVPGEGKTFMSLNLALSMRL